MFQASVAERISGVWGKGCRTMRTSEMLIGEGEAQEGKRVL